MVYNCTAYKYLNECTVSCHFALNAAAYTPRQHRKCVNFNYYSFAHFQLFGTELRLNTWIYFE